MLLSLVKVKIILLLIWKTCRRLLVDVFNDIGGVDARGVYFVPVSFFRHSLGIVRITNRSGI